MKSIAHQLSDESAGGAHLVGAKGVVVIGHGSSSRQAVTRAVEMAADGAERGLVERLAERLARMSGDIDALAERLGYRFSDRAPLEDAMVHRSYAAEHPTRSDNERLEFLGDAVLQLVVTDYLFDNFPDLPEGQLAKVRAACVNRDELAVIARHLDLGHHVLLGRGERASGGQEKDSILADAMEALLAAVYLDSDLETVRRIILKWWEPLIVERAADPGKRDYKTRLQESLAERGSSARAICVTEFGPDHAKEFVGGAGGRR